MNTIELPHWLQELRREEIIDPIKSDLRSQKPQNQVFLGLSKQQAFNAIAGGQADFTKPYGDLSTDDLALLYAYLNQKGHLEELISAFRQIFSGTKLSDLICLDLGSGPFTGGLALASTLGEYGSFDYIGIDLAPCMQKLGEHLASSLRVPGNIKRQWCSHINDVKWTEPPSWRPVLIIISYLLASHTLNVTNLISELTKLLTRFGHDKAILLYTNSAAERHNSNFDTFQKHVIKAGFKNEIDDIGTVAVKRGHQNTIRQLRYSLFTRPEIKKLSLE